jgi:hypothetical protein
MARTSDYQQSNHRSVNLLNNFKRNATNIADLQSKLNAGQKSTFLREKDSASTTQQGFGTANVSLNKSRNKEMLIEPHSPDEQRNTYSSTQYPKQIAIDEKYKAQRIEKDPKKKFSPSPNYSIDFEKYRINVLEKLNNKKIVANNLQQQQTGTMNVGVIKSVGSGASMTSAKTFKKIDDKKTVLYKK